MLVYSESFLIRLKKIVVHFVRFRKIRENSLLNLNTRLRVTRSIRTYLRTNSSKSNNSDKYFRFDLTNVYPYRTRWLSRTRYRKETQYLSKPSCLRCVIELPSRRTASRRQTRRILIYSFRANFRRHFTSKFCQTTIVPLILTYTYNRIDVAWPITVSR